MVWGAYYSPWCEITCVRVAIRNRCARGLAAGVALSSLSPSLPAPFVQSSSQHSGSVADERAMWVVVAGACSRPREVCLAGGVLGRASDACACAVLCWGMACPAALGSAKPRRSRRVRGLLDSTPPGRSAARAGFSGRDGKTLAQVFYQLAPWIRSRYAS